jgi:hypothetical protein
MDNWQTQTPVALLFFNRPDTTARVFAEIAKARPPILLLVADGPRTARPGEGELCAAARAVVKRVDWDCQVLRDYSDQNLGCRRRVSSGLDWVFDQVEQAIILEDDCLPHPTFFRFCDELLDRYRDDERIMTISGNNHQFGHRPTTESYYFSRYNHIWGWATWRRAWQHYDVDIKLWPRIRDEGWLQDMLGDRHAIRYWTKTLQATFEGRIDTWDFQWILACWLQHGLTAIPCVNLVTNIGFGLAATHTQGVNRFANLPIEAMHFPLTHPPFMIRNAQSDDYIQKSVFYDPRTLTRTKALLKTLLSGQ